MIEREHKVVGFETRSGVERPQRVDELPYWIELWKAEAARVERVLGRAVSVQMARAIYVSAQSEFPGRRVTIRHGGDTVLDSAR